MNQKIRINNPIASYRVCWSDFWARKRSKLRGMNPKIRIKMKIINTPYFSQRMGSLPKGCQQCIRGEKLVLFVTGMCPRRCFYCPISDKKSSHDVTYANERKVKAEDIKAIIEEARLCGSKGAGFTGGDPLSRLDRSVNYIKALKKAFGKEFHIHLYTSMDLVNEKTLSKLYKAGLDEIRFHLDIENDKLWDRILIAQEFDWDVGVEIPVVPGKIRETKNMMKFLDGKIDFMNLNELEMSDGKASSVSELGYIAKNKMSYGVKGSDSMGKQLLKFGLENKVQYKMHYCTAKLKDKVQLSNRIKRRANNVAKAYDVVTPDGLLQRGAVYGKSEKGLSMIRKWLVDEVGVPEELVEIDKERKRILTNTGVVLKLSDELKEEGWKPAIVSEYPTWDRLIIELDWL